MLNKKYNCNIENNNNDTGWNAVLGYTFKEDYEIRS